MRDSAAIDQAHDHGQDAAPERAHDGERTKSNAELGAENLERLRAWLDAAERVPELNGKANLSAIATGAGVRRQVLYSKDGAALVTDAVGKKGLGMPAQQRTPGADAVPAWASQRIKQLEEQLAVAQAETRDLRGRLRRLEHLERHVEETGMLAR